MSNRDRKIHILCFHQSNIQKLSNNNQNEMFCALCEKDCFYNSMCTIGCSIELTEPFSSTEPISIVPMLERKWNSTFIFGMFSKNYRKKTISIGCVRKQCKNNVIFTFLFYLGNAKGKKGGKKSLSLVMFDFTISFCTSRRSYFMTHKLTSLYSVNHLLSARYFLKVLVVSHAFTNLVCAYSIKE